ncbi:transcriptional regulator, LysR family [Aedoeadaptatus coxii]|uniref:Transcriptional regulator, LysR family n=1 Tax=Aedoeadaptatus coxii TaxID=755172 RepID=A0A134ALI7_9FIRM|nr:LysR family transcriptional regulator [Peptoniphilus coxii]KXB68410.1 transcriptional regulator, LysR family [Peptoniphilus coxii]
MDTRLATFLEVIDTRNYTKASKNLHITQPAVTKHIHSLEEEFGVKLFTYDGKKILMTKEAERLESYARGLQKNYRDLVDSFRAAPLKKIRIGLTKTIGNYAYVEELSRMMKNRTNEFAITIDNTGMLLDQLRNAQLDFLIVEGRFSKSEFDYEILTEDLFTGLCAPGDPLAGGVFNMEELGEACLLLREPGSGSREILEQKLQYKGYDVGDFKRLITCSSLQLITKLVEREVGITFGYESILKEEPNLATFHVRGITDRHEFSLVALKGTGGIELYHELKRT